MLRLKEKGRMNEARDVEQNLLHLPSLFKSSSFWRKFLLFSMLISCFFVMAACGPKAESEPEDNPSSAHSEQQSLADEEPVESKEEVPEESQVQYDPLDPELIALEETSVYQVFWPVDLSFYQVAESPEAKLFHAMFFPALLREHRTAEGFEFLPELLSELPKISEDGLELTLSFREEPLIPGQQHVSAEDFHNFLKEMLSAKRHNPLAIEIIRQIPIVGAAEYYRGAIRNNYNPSELAAEAAELKADLLSYNQDKEVSERLGYGFLTPSEILAELEPEATEDESADSEAESEDLQSESEVETEATAAELETEDVETEESEVSDEDETDPELSPEEQAAELKQRLTAYLKKEEKNFGRNISQRVYDQLPEKRPLWSTVGISLLEPPEAAEAELQDQPRMQLQLRLERPINRLNLYHLLSQYGPLLYRSGFDKEFSDQLLDGEHPDDDWQKIKAELSSSLGPYSLDQISNKSLILRLNKEHLNAQVQDVDLYHFRKLKDPKDLVSAFVEGALDEYRYRGVFNLDRHHERAKEFPGAVWSLFFNQRAQLGREYIAQENFRVALGLSLHRKYLVSSIIPHMESCSTLISPAVLDPYDWSSTYRDCLEAKANVAPNDGLDMLAAEAAFSQILTAYALPKLDCSLLYPASSEDLEKIAIELKTQWELFFKEERIELKLEAVPMNELIARMVQGDYEIALAPFHVDPFDPLAAFASFSRPGFDNLINYDNPQFTVVYDDLRQREAALTEAEWRGGLAMLERFLLDDKSILPLFLAKDYIVFGPEVEYQEPWLPGLEFRNN